jgi:hypothetical protein
LLGIFAVDDDDDDDGGGFGGGGGELRQYVWVNEHVTWHTLLLA